MGKSALLDSREKGEKTDLKCHSGYECWWEPSSFGGFSVESAGSAPSVLWDFNHLHGEACQVPGPVWRSAGFCLKVFFVGWESAWLLCKAGFKCRGINTLPAPAPPPLQSALNQWLINTPAPSPQGWDHSEVCFCIFCRLPFLPWASCPYSLTAFPVPHPS